MKTFFFFLPFFFLNFLFCQSIQQSKNSVPFTLTEYNNISVEAIFNQQDTVNLMFHIAFNGLGTIRSSKNKLTSIKWNTSDTAESWGGKSISQRSNYNKLQIGAFSWDSLMVTQSEKSGLETDGKFGANLFETDYLEINFDSETIIIHPRMPDYSSKFETIELINQNGSYFIEAKLHIGNEFIKDTFMLHSGYSSAIILDNSLVKNESLSEKLPVISESKILDSFGNELITTKTQIEEISFGGISLKKVPTSFFKTEGQRLGDSIIGMDVLKRFNLIVDRKKNLLYLQKNSLYSDEYSTFQ